MVNRKSAVILIEVVLIIVVATVTAVIINQNTNPERTATFDLNYDDSENIVMKTSNGAEIASPTPVREGYHLVGWYLDKELTQYAKFPYKMNSNTTFYARWSDKAASVFFNEDYLKDTASGIALSNQSRYTKGAEIAKIDGKEFNVKVIASGSSYLVLDLDLTDKLISVVSMDDFKVMFTIPSDVVSINAVGLTQSDTEFIIAQYYSGYYIYDLCGNSVGPASDEPQIVVADTVLFDGTFYRFDSEGRIFAAFDASKRTHIPSGGNGTTYYEIERMDVLDDTYDYAVNILNDRFEVIKTLKFQDKAKLGVVVTLPYGGYLVQYGIAGTSSEKYVIEKDGTNYFLNTYLIDSDLEITELTLKRFIVSSYDRMNAPAIAWDSYANDTVGLAVVQNGKDSTELCKISSNGRVLTVVNRLAYINCSAVMASSTACFYKAVIIESQQMDAQINIFDGTGKIFTSTVQNIANVIGERYFVTKATDEASRTDFNIYTIKGEIAGTFEGYTYKDSSHNVLFFEKDGNSYAFRDGAMTKICDGTDVRVYLWGYSYADSDKYIFCSENGTVISESCSNTVTTYENAKGEYVININVTSGEYRLFKLTV